MIALKLCYKTDLWLAVSFVVVLNEYNYRVRMIDYSKLYCIAYATKQIPSIVSWRVPFNQSDYWRSLEELLALQFAHNTHT